MLLATFGSEGHDMKKVSFSFPVDQWLHDADGYLYVYDKWNHQLHAALLIVIDFLSQKCCLLAMFPLIFYYSQTVAILIGHVISWLTGGMGLD